MKPIAIHAITQTGDVFIVGCTHGGAAFEAFYDTFTGDVTVPNAINPTRGRWQEFYREVKRSCQQFEMDEE